MASTLVTHPLDEATTCAPQRAAVQPAPAPPCATHSTDGTHARSGAIAPPGKPGSSNPPAVNEGKLGAVVDAQEMRRALAGSVPPWRRLLMLC